GAAGRGAPSGGTLRGSLRAGGAARDARSVAAAESVPPARQGHRPVRGAVRALAERGPAGKGGDPSFCQDADGEDPRSAGGEAGVKGELIAVGSELLLFGRRDT